MANFTIDRSKWIRGRLTDGEKCCAMGWYMNKVMGISLERLKRNPMGWLAPDVENYIKNSLLYCPVTAINDRFEAHQDVERTYKEGQLIREFGRHGITLEFV